MKRKDLAVLPRVPECRDPFLYIVEFSDGVIKVGSSRNPRTRLETLFDKARRDGRALSRFQIAAIEDRQFFWEARLIDRCLRIGNRVKGREWIGGIRFGEASNLLRQVQLRACATAAGVVGA